MLCFLVLVSLYLAVLAFSFGGIDFGVYYAAGRVLLHGGNPYEYSQLAAEIVSSTGELNNPYYYAPWFTWGVSILALLPYEAARISWAVLNYFFWFWGLMNLSRLLYWPASGWRRWGMYLLATIMFAWTTWGSEQVGILIFLIFTALLLAYEKEQWLLMGGWMALLLFKPNITAFPLIILSVWLLLNRNWKPVAYMAGMLFAMTAVSLIVSPGWYLALLQPDKITGLSYTLNEAGEVQILRYTTTLLDWLAVYGIKGSLAYVIYAVMALGGIVFIARSLNRTRSIVHLTAFSLLVNFALIPYALFYDYPPLALTLFFINDWIAATPSLKWVQRLMNGSVFASLFIGDNISYRYWVVVILISSAVASHFFSKTAAPSDMNSNSN